MDIKWRVVPWLSRFVLLAATVIFSLVAVKYLADPVYPPGEVAVYEVDRRIDGAAVAPAVRTAG